MQTNRQTNTPTTAPSNVVLIGMPGAGKSTAGVVLAKMLGYGFIDGDLLIQEQQGATLQQIIDAEGADAFLAIENDALCSLECSRCVIAPGGSAVYSPAAMAHLAANGVVAYLRVSLESLNERLGNLDQRGVVFSGASVKSLEDLYAQRAALYEQYAHITIDVDGMATADVARALKARVSGPLGLD